MAVPVIPIIMAVAALAPVVADLIGKALSAGDTDKAKQLADEAIRRFDLKPPDIAAMTAKLEKSAMAEARADPESIATQRSALASLRRYGQASPDDIELRAGVDAAKRAADQQAAGQNQALLREMQARGRGNTGAEYAVRALGNQQASERAAAGGFQAAADSKRSALQALQATGGLASTMRGQSFDEEARRAQASDDLARFNEESRADAVRQDWANRFGLAGAQSDVGFRGSNIYAGRAADTQETARNVGQGVGQAAGAFGNYYMDTQRERYPRGR